MNGLASDTPPSQSLLQPTDNLPLAAHIAGAGSTAISDSQSSLHDASTPTDQISTSIDAISAPTNDSEDLGAQKQPESTGAEAVVVQKEEAGIEAQDKGGSQAAAVAHIESPATRLENEVPLEAINGQIELVEHTPESASRAGEAGLIVQEDGQDWIPDSDHELKRVKVYELIGSRWIDQGTAFCFGQFSDETNEALLIARSETNYNEIILSTAIRSNDVYQRQQDTLIVWTEPDGVDYALSFQDPDGCAEVWNFILEVQRHMNGNEDQHVVSSSPLLGPELSVTSASIIRSGHLPPPQLGIISEIERAIKALSRTQIVKERICEYIQNEDYIKALIKVMADAEDLESLENLHALCSLMQTILMLNDHTLYEHILEDEIFYGVVGMLEYDPDFPGHKANYRDFLRHTAQFHQPIPMRDILIQRKIHHTYRLQFLKDVVLARALDDSTFNVLNSCIIFNQIDIITYIQQDPSFLRDIVRLFVDEDMLTGGGPNARRIQLQPQAPTSAAQPSSQHMIISLNGNGDNVTAKSDATSMDVDQRGGSTSLPSSSSSSSISSPTPSTSLGPLANGRPKRPNAYAFAPPDDLTPSEIKLRREVVLLLQQLCIMGKNVQMPARMALFRTLVDRGVLFAVQWALTLPEKEETTKQMISAGGEVLSAVLDHDLSGVRGHVLKQILAIEKEREAHKKGADKAETVVDMACRLLATSKDLTVQSQVGDCLKVWLDIPNTPDPPQASSAGEIGPKLPVASRKDDPTTERFMEYFYKECIQKLMKPIMDLPQWKNYNEPILPLVREETNRYVYLCDLLHNFIQQHMFRSHFYVMSTDILSRVPTLFKAKDKHLRHSAFRIFRLLLKQGNANSHAQILKHDILKPILDLTLKESVRDNLLSCSCQEYFDHMRKDNIKELIKSCMTHQDEVQKLTKSPLGSNRFELLIRRWEMNNAPPPEEATPDKIHDRAWSGPGHLLDLAEEDYFNAEDDDDDVIPSISQQSQSWLNSSPLLSNNTGMKRKRRPGISASPKGYRPPLKTPLLNSLVDYEEDEDEPSPTAESTPQASGSRSVSPENKASTIQQPSSAPSSPALNSLNTAPSPGPPPKRAAKEEDDDNLFEALARNNRARSQSPLPSLGPMRPAEKRRRAEDEDDELFARLSKTPKKSDLGNQKEPSLSIPGRSKNGDDPPGKKIKVKLGAIGMAVASAPVAEPTTISPGTCPPSSEISTKDGDTG